MLTVIAVALAVILLLSGGMLLVTSGALTLDTGWGRRTRALGPQLVRIAAPRELVFDMVAAPYGVDPPRGFHGKIEVLARGTDMVLAAHRTKIGRLTAVTVETVTFTRPERIGFRLVRGPVPFVVEEFVLRELQDRALTELEYTGELGTDGWAVGAAWGDRVARRWEHVVAGSLADLKSAAESIAAMRSEVGVGRE
ncbi:MAG: hypothetical protein NVS1B1_00150 [Candidatus Limnocylindrales bacterium]